MLLSRLGIRQQLLGLFGLFLLTGALVLALDEIGQHYSQQSLTRMKDEGLTSLRGIRELSDAYGEGVIQTTLRARDGVIERADGLARLELAQATTEREWARLSELRPAFGEDALLEQALLARPRADAAMQELREVLASDDARALARFADQELFTAVDPLVDSLQRIEDHRQAGADSLVQADLARGKWTSRLRILLTLSCFGLAGWFGPGILRNAYRGVESLADLSRHMVAHDYRKEPLYRPSGELGEVMDGFLRMRAHVQRIEAHLTEQLARNDRVRIALERREHFQSLLLEAAQTAIFAVDEEGVFSQVNPFAEQLLGWPADALVGRERMDAVLDPEALQALSRHLSDAYGQKIAADWTALRALAQHQEPPRELVLRHQRGRTLPVLLAVSAMRDENGAMIGLLAVATDLTVLKRLERALRDSETRAREASHAKSAFLAAMSHEIRTPMIGVTGMIEVLAHTSLDDEQRRSLDVIQTSANTLLRIIGDILDFSKIEAGRLELDLAPTSLPELMRSVVASHAGAASSKGLSLTCEVDARVGPAHLADSVRLRQVLGNFLSNAIKFTEHGSVLAALEVHRSDPAENGSDTVVFRVTDTGIGISEQAQARLFQPFSQAEVDTTRRFGGTGLGLTISRRLAELMGGEIEMESVPGVGTSMRMVLALPRVSCPASPTLDGQGRLVGGFTPRRLPSVPQAEAERSLVLLVDDHPTNRQVIQRQLALAGYACETVDNGVDALARWRSSRYALVLSDVHMPLMDGYQLARTIREEEARRGLSRTPIVALTASALKGDAERCLAAGMDDYMAKPVGIATLGACLQRWLPHTASRVPTSAELITQVQTANAQKAVALATSLLPIEPPPTLDPVVLAELTGDSASEASALLADYLATTDDDLAQLDAMRHAGDLHALTRQAHKIKGAAKLVGAEELAYAATSLEAAGRAGDWVSVLPRTVDVVTALERLRLDVAVRYPG